MDVTEEQKQKLSEALGVDLEKLKELNCSLDNKSKTLKLSHFSIPKFDMDILSSLDLNIHFDWIDFECEVQNKVKDFEHSLTFEYCTFDERFLLGGINFSRIKIKDNSRDLQSKAFHNICVKCLIVEDVTLLLNDSKIDHLVVNGEQLSLKGATFKFCLIHSQDPEKIEELTFENCTFNGINLNHILPNDEAVNENIIKMPKATFKECHFQSDITIRENIGDLYFDSCEFHANFIARNLNVNKVNPRTSFKNNPLFENCIFSSIDFSNSVFETDVAFHKSKFKDQVNFKEVEFKGNADFSKSIFEKSTDFSRNKFEKTADFYGVKFKKIPNFFQAIFNGNINLVNVKIDGDFKTLKKDLESQYKTSSHAITKQSIWHKIKNWFLHKNSDDNTDLEGAEKASDDNTDLEGLAEKANDLRDSFRVFKNTLIKENNLLDASQWHKLELYAKEIELDFNKPKAFSRDWIDKWALSFYRHTSDHHTDLLKIWHNLLIVIGIFGILSAVVVVGFDYGFLKFWSLNPHSLMQAYKIHIGHYIKVHNYAFIWNLVLFIIFIGIVALLFLAKARNILIILSYVVTMLIFLSSPKYIIPAMSIFTDKRSMFDPLSVIGGVYTLLFVLMLYSFIKTARKNSIIPH